VEDGAPLELVFTDDSCKKADYETKTIAFRVRVEFVEPIKKMVKDYVSERLKGDA
jgi:hypothetical protein